MSIAENSRIDPKSNGGVQQQARSTPGRGRLARRKLIYVFFKVVFFPVRTVARLPFVTKAARAEARTVTVTRLTLEQADWPSAFEGLKVAFLTDIHCGPFSPPSFVAQAVQETNKLKPDLVLLGGDYVTTGIDYIQPVADVLANLEAPMGVYSVLGNHDYRQAPDAIRSALKRVGIIDVTNYGSWLTKGSDRIRVAGVGDLWHDTQDLDAALSGATGQDAVILLSHNPDYAMRLSDPRVKLMLSGHTHGGQIILPGIGPLVTNTRYGLVSGLVSFPTFRLYISRGLGTVGVPMRYHCPPEIALFTLTAAKTESLSGERKDPGLHLHHPGSH